MCRTKVCRDERRAATPRHAADADETPPLFSLFGAEPRANDTGVWQDVGRHKHEIELVLSSLCTSFVLIFPPGLLDNAAARSGAPPLERRHWRLEQTTQQTTAWEGCHNESQSEAAAGGARLRVAIIARLSISGAKHDTISSS